MRPLLLHAHQAPEPEPQPEAALVLPTQHTQTVAAGSLFDWVLNFYDTQALGTQERRLVLDEVHRHGFGTRYNNDRYPQALSMTVAEAAAGVPGYAVQAALRLGLACLEPRRGPLKVQYARFPLPAARGRFDSLYNGPALALLGTLEHP